MAIVAPVYKHHCPADFPIRLTIISPDSTVTVDVVFSEIYLTLGFQSWLNFEVCKMG